MGLMPVPGDRPDLKTCLQVYNRAGFSIEFAMVRSKPAALRLRTFNSGLVRGAAPPGPPERPSASSAPHPRSILYCFIAPIPNATFASVVSGVAGAVRVSTSPVVKLV